MINFRKYASLIHQINMLSLTAVALKFRPNQISTFFSSPLPPSLNDVIQHPAILPMISPPLANFLLEKHKQVLFSSFRVVHAASSHRCAFFTSTSKAFKFCINFSFENYKTLKYLQEIFFKLRGNLLSCIELSFFVVYWIEVSKR